MTSLRRASLLLVPALLLGCRPHLRIEVTRPAQVAIQPEIQKLAVVDRVSSDDSSAAVAEFIDGMLGLKAARFDLVDRQSSRALYASLGATEGAPLNRAQTQQLCDQTDASGVVALESASASGDWSLSERTEQETTTETVTTNGRSVTRDVTREVIVHEATFLATTAVTWRLYGCGDIALDTVTIRIDDAWYGEGTTPTEARQDVGETEALLGNLIAATGTAYLQRISPYEELLSRPYYRGLGGNLRAGSIYLAAGNLEKAEEAYRGGMPGAGDRKKGKLLYDLALVAEQRGDLDEALRLARRAHALLDNDLSAALLGDLRARRRELKTVAEQLSPAPE